MARAAKAKEKGVLEAFGGGVEFVLSLTVLVAVFAVAVLFQKSVNRMFDVPKALSLKVGGAGALLGWVFYGLFGRGFRLAPLRFFMVPLGCLVLSVLLSALAGIDFATSYYGVYERQFGFQGYLACFGIFVVAATCLREKQAALFSLAALVTTGGTLGTYALLQRYGFDPYGFFGSERVHLKVYSTLGNPNFAGNSLALLLPVSLAVAWLFVKKSMEELTGGGRLSRGLTVVFGGALVVALQVVPAMMSPPANRQAHQGGVLASFVVLLAPVFWGGSWRFKCLSAGGVSGMALFVAYGVIATLTRGAIVGSLFGLLGAAFLVPFFFRGQARFRRVAMAVYGSVATMAIALTLFVVTSDNYYASVGRSVFHAFSKDVNEQGKGQGTRKYLWSESFRVLTRHQETLVRQQKDARDIESLGSEKTKPDIFAPVESAWSVRTALVWVFGVGIENYRYAFMSHKSKELELLDPMTNHDNPHNNYLYVLASLGLVGLFSYLFLLGRVFRFAGARFLNRDGAQVLEDRILSFGLLTSFMSYAVYSIAGFDSVACSVFLFFLLGAVSAYFSPKTDEPVRSLSAHFISFLGRRGVKNAASFKLVFRTVCALTCVLILGHTLFTSIKTYAADKSTRGPARGGALSNDKET